MESFVLQVELFGVPTAITSSRYSLFTARARVTTTGPFRRESETTSTQAKKTVLFAKCGKKLVITASSDTKLLASITSTAKADPSVCVTGP